MLQHGRWATTFLFVFLGCVYANSAPFFNKNQQECNRTRPVLRETFEIFEPRDWVEELKYLQNVVMKNLIYETNNKRAILEGTPYCKACTVQASNKKQFCTSYCGLEIYNLKNRTTMMDTKVIGTLFATEMKNKSVTTTPFGMTELKNRSLTLSNNVKAMKNRTMPQAEIVNLNRTRANNFLAILAQMKILMISNRTEGFTDFIQLNRTRATMMTAVQKFKENNDETIEMFATDKRKVLNNLAMNRIIKAIMTHNRTRALINANRTRNTNNFNAITPQIEPEKNRSIAMSNAIIHRREEQQKDTPLSQENNMMIMKKDLEENPQFSVAKWVMNRNNIQNEKPPAFNNIMENVASSCAAMFMYAMSNPMVCSKL